LYILLFIGFLDFSINKKLCFLFHMEGKNKRVEYSTEILKIQKKRAITLRYDNLSLLKGFERFITRDLCELTLEAK